MRPEPRHKARVCWTCSNWYENADSLDGWAEAAVESRETYYTDVELLGEMPSARVYRVLIEGEEQWTNVIGLVEEEGRPMSISISARNVTLEELREMGLIDELEAMIASLEYRDGEL